jgi:hypothetical protein
LRFLLIISFCIYCYASKAQNTVVRGTIIDAVTKETLPFAAVAIKNTKASSASDENGEFIVSSDTPGDSLLVSMVGYKTASIFIKRNTSQRVDVLLETNNYNLAEIVIRPGRNPAFRIMDHVVESKSLYRNNSSVKQFSWEEYEKFQIYFGNYSKKFTDRKQFAGYKFIFDLADSTKDGKPLLPIFMSESISRVSRADSSSSIEKNLIAEKRTGETYEQLTSIADKMTANIEIYSDFFLILDKSFISPLNSNYQLYYKYYLEDSLFIDNQRCYKIRFLPKWKEDLAFSGEMYVHDSTWAIKKITLAINNEINLNYVKDFQVRQEFSRFENKWLQKIFETSATISPIKRKSSEEFTVHRTTSLKDFIIRDPERINEQIILNKNRKPVGGDDQYWDSARHDTLNQKEKYSYLIADTLNYVPAVKKVKKAAIAFASGYLEFGKISIGQIHTFYSFNPVEQDRYKLGLRTTKQFSRKFQLEGYGAYGSSDEIWKYKASVLYVPMRGGKRLSIGASYLYDIQQLGVSANHIQIDNILTSLTRTSNLSRLSYVREINLRAEKYWTKGFATSLQLNTAEISPAGSWKLERQIAVEADVRQQIPTLFRSELKIGTRFSFVENVIDSEFQRTSLGSKYPILEIDLSSSFKGLLNAEYNYQKVNVKLKGKLRLNPLGYTKYTIDGGKVFGDAPFLLSYLHPGNQTLIYDTEAFNLMKYFEFASDEYVSLHLDHHFEGFFLNKIPLVRKAQLREVVSFRGVAGNLNQNTIDQMMLPEGMGNVSEPYMECSAGLENIFKVVRIDYIWRISHKSPFAEDNWSIKAKFYFSF